jgi:hypothetical protein
MATKLLSCALGKPFYHGCSGEATRIDRPGRLRLISDKFLVRAGLAQEFQGQAYCDSCRVSLERQKVVKGICNSGVYSLSNSLFIKTIVDVMYVLVL